MEGDPTPDERRSLVLIEDGTATVMIGTPDIGGSRASIGLMVAETLASVAEERAEIRNTLIVAGASFALAIGKSPVIVRSAPGFLVNRVLMPYMLGAVERVGCW